MNLLEALQKHFGYPHLIKIDPNTQDIKQERINPDENRLSQAALPAILVGLYKYTSSDAGAETIVRGNYSPKWVEMIFGEHYSTVINRIAEYAGYDPANITEKLNEIALKAVEFVRNATGPDHKITAVKSLLAAQRNNVLPYLPAALHIGELIDDNTIDDRTNKMEGPVSNLMHSLGAGFSGTDKDNKLSQIK